MTRPALGGAPRAEETGENGFPPVLVRARVCAGDVSISYVQAGEGLPVVVLGAAPESDTTRLLFLERLSRHLRVLAPAMEDGARAAGGGDGGTRVAFSRRLRDFIDGLGLGPVGLVAEESFGVRALAFSLADPERVERVALVLRDGPDPSAAPGTTRDTFAATGTPVLVLRVGVGDRDPDSWAATCSADLVGFLAGAAEALPGSIAP
jgi:hypothetical protein